MKIFKVTFDNGDSLVTRLNGTIEDARKYYIGTVFNLGVVDDDMHRCVKVEEISDQEPVEQQ